MVYRPTLLINMISTNRWSLRVAAQCCVPSRCQQRSSFTIVSIIISIIIRNSSSSSGIVYRPIYRHAIVYRLTLALFHSLTPFHRYCNFSTSNIFHTKPQFQQKFGNDPRRLDRRCRGLERANTLG